MLYRVLCLNTILFCSIFSNFGTNALIDLDLIESYFKEKSVISATIFGCFNKSEKIQLIKNLSTKTEFISVLELSRNGFEKNLQTDNSQIAVIVDGDCEDTEKFLVKCSQNKLFDVKHHWLIQSSSSDILKIFHRVNLNIDALIHVAILDKNISNWTISDVYNPSTERGGRLNITKLGFYNKLEGYNARFTDAMYWRRKNLTGVTFKTMVVLPVPFKGSLDDYLESDADPDINTFNRFHCRLVQFCQIYYNFSMNISANDSWGYTNPDGTFDGMVGGLEREKLDFGCSPLFVREDRGRVIRYGRLTWILKAAFIFRNPKTKSSFEIFLKPFSTAIWLIIGLFGVCGCVILKNVLTFERIRYRDKNETSWSLSAILTLGAFCQQGFPKTPKLTCGRVITFATFALSILIYQFYSATIVSNLLMNPKTVINNLVELLNSQLRAGCEDILYTKDFFKHSADPLIKTFFAKKIGGKDNNSHFLAPEVGLKLVEKGDYAFHVETATAYPLIEASFEEKVICELREVQLFRTQPMHANYQKNTPFRDMLDTCLHRLAEYGIIYRERRFWHPRKPECIQSARTVAITVGLLEFYPALVALVIGIGVSLLVLCVEIYVKHDESAQLGGFIVRQRTLPFVE